MTRASRRNKIAAMLTRNLPEELMREILGYVLHRVRASFETAGFDMEQDWTTIQELIAIEPPERPGVNATTLLVCKQWYRVGMPLLYESVVVDNPAQLKTLATTLTNRPELGRAIRRLRLAHAFGKDLVTVLSLTPNIHTLAISVYVSSKESVAGLRKALVKSRMAATPTRLLIQPPQYILRNRPNANTTRIATSLAVLVSLWPDLKRVDIGGEDMPGWVYTLLREAKGLEYVGVSSETAEHMMMFRTDAERLTEQPLFKNILCRGPQRMLDELKNSHPGRVADAMVSEHAHPDLYIL